MWVEVIVLLLARAKSAKILAMTGYRFCCASMSLGRMQAEDCGVFLGVSPPRSVGDRGCSSSELVEVIRIVAAEHTVRGLLDGATGEYDLS